MDISADRQPLLPPVMKRMKQELTNKAGEGISNDSALPPFDAFDIPGNETISLQQVYTLNNPTENAVFDFASSNLTEADLTWDYDYDLGDSLRVDQTGRSEDDTTVNASSLSRNLSKGSVGPRLDKLSSTPGRSPKSSLQGLVNQFSQLRLKRPTLHRVSLAFNRLLGRMCTRRRASSNVGGTDSREQSGSASPCSSDVPICNIGCTATASETEALVNNDSIATDVDSDESVGGCGLESGAESYLDVDLGLGLMRPGRNDESCLNLLEISPRMISSGEIDADCRRSLFIDFDKCEDGLHYNKDNENTVNTQKQGSDTAIFTEDTAVNGAVADTYISKSTNPSKENSHDDNNEASPQPRSPTTRSGLHFFHPRSPKRSGWSVLSPLSLLRLHKYSRKGRGDAHTKASSNSAGKSSPPKHGSAEVSNSSEDIRGTLEFMDICEDSTTTNNNTNLLPDVTRHYLL